MGTVLGNPPIRLRQLLSSGEGMMRPLLKLDTDAPPKVKEFIDRVIRCPLSDIRAPLSSFCWEYSKGNFHHWRPLFIHFDTYFKTYIGCREDLLLSTVDKDEDGPFPKYEVLLILRVMQTILENCPNKSSFNGLEHFNRLLASTDPEVLLAVLQTLTALVKINPSKLHVSGKMIGLGSLNGMLLSLAQGWGSKEQGLGLFTCVVSNEQKKRGQNMPLSDDLKNEHESPYRSSSSLHFEFPSVSDGIQSPGLCTIHIPDIQSCQDDDLSILKQCVDRYNVPLEQRFSLLSRIRFARATVCPSTARQYSKICLLAFIALVQANDAHDELVAFSTIEPEFTNDLLKLVRSDIATVPEDIRTLAVIALGAQLTAYSSSHERARVLSGASVIAGGTRMGLLGVLQKAVMSLDVSSDLSSVLFISALLNVFLLHVISSSSSGSSARGSGLVPALLPLLKDVEMSHMHIVCSAVKILQKLMDYSNAAVSLFRDLGGIHCLIQRLQVEIERVIDSYSSNDSLMITDDTSVCGDDILYNQKRLIKALLKALGSATYAPANSGRSQNIENTLPAALTAIFCHANRFGGDIYFAAVTVMSEIIHKDPTCFPILYEAGLPDAFLSSLNSGVLPSAKAISCIPSGLGAICLNAKGLEAVKERNALSFLLQTCTTKKYLVAMNEGIVSLANGLEELLRHVSSLRSIGVELIIKVIEKLATLEEKTPSSVEKETAMDLDSEEKVNEVNSLSAEETESVLKGVSPQRFFQLCVFHAMLLVHRTMENAETCRLFVEKKGIEAMIKLLLMPNITQSSEGLSTSMYTASVFRGFTQQHSGSLAQVFCSSLRSHLTNALNLFSSLPGLFLLDPHASHTKEYFSSLFIVEYLLFLIDASKENRWLNALLNEFGNDNKDILHDIGRLHREVLWQITLLEDSKPDGKDLKTSSSVQYPKSDLVIHDPGEPRLNSFRQFLDPLLRPRLSGFGLESQLLDFVNLYNDVYRTPGIQRRLGLVASASMRLGSNTSQGQPSSSSDGVSTVKSDAGHQKSFYSSCCDMMKSLCFHISHLFLELGKVMVLPSRRRDDATNISPSAKSVLSILSSIILDDLNFGGNGGLYSSEQHVWIKCRYIGKIIDFIDVILLDRPDSCNPILLNCFYSYGVVQATLTTFEATTQLLFTVNRVPTSPMDTEDVDVRADEKLELEYHLIYSALRSYSLLIDHLVTSSFILAPFAKHLLIQPLTSQSTVRDPETFVKIIQSKVLKTVLPIWNHPQFSECNDEFIGAIISIVGHIYSGVEVKNSNNTIANRASGPPPDESSISMIVEMGFSRSRAEEALRQVGTNSVEMAMEWLFSHPEEIQEDDELARALAMSLGNSSSLMTDDMLGSSGNMEQEENVHIPPVDELLSSCLRLLKMRGILAYPVRDLLVMICSQDDGHSRNKVVTFIIEHLKTCHFDPDRADSTTLSALFHVIALILHEDAGTREVAARNGLALVTLDFLSMWDPHSLGGQKDCVPKWVTTSLLSIDRMLQVETKWNSDIFDNQHVKKEVTMNLTSSVDENGSDVFNSASSSCAIQLSSSEQKRLVEIICKFICWQLPSETMHVVLQLCATLTKDHSVAVSFLESGGLVSLLCLPTRSLFPGFDSIAARIIRHILEDPQTLQQAMEFEIRHTLIASLNRHPTGRMTPRNFLSSMSSVIHRDPSVFILAAQSVCRIDMVGERPYVVLSKEKDRDKCKDKERTLDGDKLPSDGKITSRETSTVSQGQAKQSDGSSKTSKSHRKPPHSFATVIDLLLESVLAFVPSAKMDMVTDVNIGTSSPMEAHISIVTNKDKGKAIATMPDELKQDCLEASASLAKTFFLLKLLSEIFFTYSSSVHVLLRKDAEIGGSRVQSQREPGALCRGGIFHHVLHKFLCSGNTKKDKKFNNDWTHKLAARAGQFLVAAAVRSAEACKRTFTEINTFFGQFVQSYCKKPNSEVQAFVDLLNDIIAARSPSGSYMSAEVSSTFVDVGLIQSLTSILQVLDLDHADTPKIVSGIVKSLESVTKECSHSPDSITMKCGTTSSADQTVAADDSGNMQSLGNALQPNDIERETGRLFNVSHMSGSSHSAMDDMDQEHDINGGFMPEMEDDYMHENPEEAGALGNGVDTVEISFSIQQDPQDHLIEADDEEMSGDEGDEVDEEDDVDDEGNDELDEDETHHLSHPDTDQDDHEVDEDEFDEDVMEEEDEDDEDDENGLILRLEDGINGVSVLDHIEVFSRDANDALHVIPSELFGSRHRGRTTSIYNLLGRSADSNIPVQHPLLLGPASSRTIPPRRADNSTIETNSTDQITEDPSPHIDAIFRSLRSGRQANRLSMWTEDSQVRGGSSSVMVTQGVEELFVSRLSRSNQEEPPIKPSDSTPPQHSGDASGLQELVPPSQEAHDTSNAANEREVFQSSEVAGHDRTRNIHSGDSQHGLLQSNDSQSQLIEMQYERCHTISRDVEAVSQESGGSGATLGESLRSLEVEIGSVDGHDDAERHIGDQPNRPRGVASLMSSLPMNTIDVSLQTVSEISHGPNQPIDVALEVENQQATGAADSGSIDPTFLEALPEELRPEVLSTQQHQVAQTSNEQSQSPGEIDPEFLAALPPDIRSEVLAQQQAQRLHSSHELEGQPVEMDTVSIIATFPSDLREEVLLTSSDAILANLTPALVAEANMLRERFAQRYHSRALLGFHSRNRRGESARGESSSSLDRVRANTSQRSGGAKVEADGNPLVDTEALKAFVRLLCIFQPLYKGQLQRLLLNLCAHRDTRVSLVQLLMEILMLDIWGPSNTMPLVGEPSYRIYGCQNALVYSSPQFPHGVPPMVSRRVLETLTYLAKNHPQVARLLLLHHLSKPTSQDGKTFGKEHGKAVMDFVDYARVECHEEDVGIVLLLNLLNQPLYLRSVAHLEQLLNLLEVIIDNAESNSGTLDKPEGSKETSAPPNIQLSIVEAVGTSMSKDDRILDNGVASKQCSSVSTDSSVLQNLPDADLRLLCSLLAKEGYSNISHSFLSLSCYSYNAMKKLNKLSSLHQDTQLSDIAHILVILCQG